MRLRHVLVGLCIAVAGAMIPVASASAGAATDPRAAESAFVAKINALRAAKGLRQLRVDAELTSIARSWAARMAARGDISHNPGFTKQVQADWVKLGENVGMGPSVDDLHRAFVASPTHYKNLVDGDFELIGVGVVVASDGTLFTAHQFETLNPAARPSAAPAKATPVATATPAAVAPAPAPPSPPPPAHAVQVLEQLRSFDLPAA